MLTKKGIVTLYSFANHLTVIRKKDVKVQQREIPILCELGKSKTYFRYCGG